MLCQIGNVSTGSSWKRHLRIEVYEKRLLIGSYRDVAYPQLIVLLVDQRFRLPRFEDLAVLCENGGRRKIVKLADIRQLDVA